MAIGGGAAPHHNPPGDVDSPAGALPDFEQPLLRAHGGLQAGKQDPAAAHDHEAQCPPDTAGATSLRTCFNGLNALSGQYSRKLEPFFLAPVPCSQGFSP